jgi:predicted MFS family arabinose efflux permease
MKNAFRALRTRNYRLFFSGQLISLFGTWMQIIGQSWLVLELSNSGVAVGFATALQFGPTLLFGVWGGLIADRLNKRRILLLTQTLFLIEALALGALTASGHIELWMVYGFALLYGLIQVFDVPARQAFVSEMVPDDDVMNAVSLNSAVFNIARTVGSAAAGLVIATVSIAACFFVNSISFVGVLVALGLMRESELRRTKPVGKEKGQIRDGLRYVRSEPDVLLPIVLMGVVSTLGLNFQIVLPLLARFTYNGDSTTFGNLTALMAIGSLVGAMYAATRKKPTKKMLVGSAAAFGALEFAAAFAPSLMSAYGALFLVGLAGFLFIVVANSTVQLSSAPEMRGRAMALFFLVLLGSTPFGGPLLGWVSETWSPRVALAIGGISSLGAAAVVGAFLATRRRRDRGAITEPVVPEEVLAAEAS